MPNYDWKCHHCGFRFEQVAPSAWKTMACPNCLINAAERQQSAPTFKVTGGTPKFYRTGGNTK